MQPAFIASVIVGLFSVSAYPQGVGNPTPFVSTPPGIIRFVSHDPLGQSPGIWGQMQAVMQRESCGRNWFEFSITNDCDSSTGCVTWTDPNELDGQFICQPIPLSYDPGDVMHECGHAMKLGHAAAVTKTATGYALVNGSVYSDPYDIQASGYGVWNICEKEKLGFLGESGLRTLSLATNSGSFYITAASSSSFGSKGLKIPLSESIIYRSGGVTVFKDTRTFYYLEVRTNHVFSAGGGKGGGGKGKKGGGSTSSVGPAVQVRFYTPNTYYWAIAEHYDPNEYHDTYLRFDLGHLGGLVAGDRFSDAFTFTKQVGTAAPTTTVTAFTVQVLVVDVNGAYIRVDFQ